MVGGRVPLLIAGPCVIEGEDMLLRNAEAVTRIAKRLQMPLLFKASYDKANRTSRASFRGPGLEEGLRLLQRVKTEFDTTVLTDAHSVDEIKKAGEVVDAIQIPAFLCRQTDLLAAAAQTGKTVNVKKGQFLAPDDIPHIINKLTAADCKRLMITERGSSFGYHRLVVDFTGIVQMRQYGWPIIFDATHSVQMPGGLGAQSGGNRRFAPYLAWAAAAVGVDGVFIETHFEPDKALSDGPNMIPIQELQDVLAHFLDIWNIK